MTDALAPVPPRALAIIAEAARQHGAPLARVQSRFVRGPVLRARQDAAFRLRTSMVMRDGKPPSYPQIARWLGWSDHTSAIYAARREAARRAALDLEPAP